MGELTEQAQENEGNMEFERMQRKYSLLQNEIEAMSVSLEKSRHFTWIWQDADDELEEGKSLADWFQVR